MKDMSDAEHAKMKAKMKPKPKKRAGKRKGEGTTVKGMPYKCS